MLMPFDAVVFDLDGTLVDTAPDLQAHVNSVLEALGRPGLGLDEVRLLVGDGARTLLRLGLEATGGVPAEVDLDVLYGRFLARYTARPADRSTLHPDVIEVLQGLQRQNVRLAVCTNKAQAPTDRLLAALGLDRFFNAVVGGDAVPAKKPDAGHLRAVLERLGASPAGSVMVGDSAHDLQAARALGVPCVLVSFGYTPVPARALGAERVIDRFADLPAALASLADLTAGHRRTRMPARAPLTPAKAGS
jgi:phosphoglycolate phosphatase